MKHKTFWVYFGIKKEFRPFYLKSLFDRSGTTDAAAEFFAENHQTSLGAEYWDWAKNQVMEKEVDVDPDGAAGEKPAVLQNPCKIETSVIGTPQAPLVYPPGDASPLWKGCWTD